MLKEASDYTYVDVSNIAVEGNILPARDMGGNGAWRALKAEDAACLAEMVCERNGHDYKMWFDTYGPAGSSLRWRSWLSYVAKYLKGAFDIVYNGIYSSYLNSVYAPVDKDYEFQARYDVSEYGRKDLLYQDAFALRPSLDYGSFDVDDPKWRLLSADIVRTMFYDMSRLTRFWSRVNGTRDGTYDTMSQMSGSPPTTGHYTGTPAWAWNAYYANGDCYSLYYTSIDSAVFTDMIPRESGLLDVSFISEMMAFLDVTTIITIDETEEEHHDVIPVQCVKFNGAWSMPQGFFTDGVASGIAARYNAPVRPSGVSVPPDEYTNSKKAVSVTWDVGLIVFKCSFPSDFSELEWTWEPKP